eukprot:8712035-Lingulodinium_polyedra.AAC.1
MPPASDSRTAVSRRSRRQGAARPRCRTPTTQPNWDHPRARSWRRRGRVRYPPRHLAPAPPLP